MSSAMAHKNEPRQRRLVGEWMARTFGQVVHELNVPLGPALEGLAEEMGLEAALAHSHPWRPKVDAVAYLPDRLVLVEAEISAPRNGVGNLLVYRRLVPETPELRAYWSRPVELVLLVPEITVQVEAMARTQGIRVAVYHPDWVEHYLEERNRYWTREYQEARQRRLEARRMLGVE